jgi:GT2 family glycosyltransferase
MTEYAIAGMVVPSFVDGGTWSASFGLSWTDTMLRDQAAAEPRIVREGGQYLRVNAGTMGVASARSTIVERFLAGRAEWLFMVDTDMGFEPDTIDRLISAAEANDCPVVGGLCFAQKLDPRAEENPLHTKRFHTVPTIYRYVKIQETGEQGFLPVMDYLPDRFQYADGTGAACMIMHRDALNRLGPNPFRPMLVRAGNPDGTDREFSEDLSFCARLANAGVPIGVDTSVKTSHHKGGIFLDEASYRAERIVATASPLGVQPRHLAAPDMDKVNA